jgi:hypothetical protein
MGQHPADPETFQYGTHHVMVNTLPASKFAPGTKLANMVELINFALETCLVAIAVAVAITFRVDIG